MDFSAEKTRQTLSPAGLKKAFRFGVVCAGTSTQSTWIAQVKRIEELGYSSLLMPDRTITPMATIPALTMAAAVTTTLRIGSYVFANGYRHPALLAREIATLDQLSSGRVEFGLGAGVGASDFQQLGIPFDGPGTRVARFEEALAIIKQYFTAETVNFAGKYYTVTDMPGIPRTLQKPHPPILMGSAGRRMLTIAGREANIVMPTQKWSDPATDVSIEQKIGWLQDAAGERFHDLELGQSAFGIELTDSAPLVASVVKGGPTAQPQPMTTEQAVEYLLKQREQLGISYIHIQERQIENCAPLVARLTGK